LYSLINLSDKLHLLNTPAEDRHIRAQSGSVTAQSSASRGAGRATRASSGGIHNKGAAGDGAPA